MKPDPVDELFRKHRGIVFRRARAMLADGDAAQDVTQEVFLRAMDANAEVYRAASPIAWLYRVTTNLCLNRLRDGSRRRRLMADGLPAIPGAVSPDLPVDAALTVQGLLRHVPEDLQEIAIYYFLDNMTQDEIAEVVGLPRRTVGYRLEQFRSHVLAVMPRQEFVTS